MHQGAGPHPYRGRLRADPSFYLELKFCNAHGLPHSEFLNWSDADRSKAIAFEIESGLRCQTCGTAPWEWEEDRFAYEVVDEYCPGCYQLDYMQDSSAKAPGHKMNLHSTRSVESAKRALAAEQRARGSR